MIDYPAPFTVLGTRYAAINKTVSDPIIANLKENISNNKLYEENRKMKGWYNRKKWILWISG